MEQVLRQLSDTELDAVSGGAAAAGATSSGDFATAIAQGGTGASSSLETRLVSVGAPFFNAVIDITFANGPSAGAGVA